MRAGWAFCQRLVNCRDLWVNNRVVTGARRFAAALAAGGSNSCSTACRGSPGVYEARLRGSPLDEVPDLSMRVAAHGDAQGPPSRSQ